MTQELISDLEAMMADRIGLRVDPSLRGRLSRSLQDEAARSGLTLSAYIEALREDGEAFQLLLNRITVQQTSFFRDAEVFDALAQHVLPNLREPVVVWSAGCSNGQEAYSLAMLLRDAGFTDWIVVATDVSTKALERARAGVYSESELAGVSAGRRAHHMRLRDRAYEILPQLQSHMRFQLHNLNSPPLPIAVGLCQLILCRNVLIYFSPQDLLGVIDRFASALPPEGYLVLGASESLWQLTERFSLHRVGGVFMYRPAAAPSPSERRQSQRPALVERRQAPSLGQLLGQGESAASAGDYVTAISAFRRATLIDPEYPVPYFQLAVCLEKAGSVREARKALQLARSAIDRCDKARFQDALDGYHVDELARVIENRLGSA